jgi:hypothetical protein
VFTSERSGPSGRLVYFRYETSSTLTVQPAQHESSQAGPMQEKHSAYSGRTILVWRNCPSVGGYVLWRADPTSRSSRPGAPGNPPKLWMD